MKITTRSFAFVGGCCLGLLAFPQLGRSQGFYLNANAGVALAQDVDLDRFVVSTPGEKLKLDPGPQFSVAGGYRFNDWLAVQAETGFMANRVKNLNNDGYDYHNLDDDYDNDDSYLTHMPLLFDGSDGHWNVCTMAPLTPLPQMAPWLLALRTKFCCST